MQTFHCAQESDLVSVCQYVAQLVKNGSSIFLLSGSLGSGKTTFVQHLFRHLGLPINQPVTSPTFSIVQEYTINNKIYAHLDLYRLDQSPDFLDLVGDPARFHAIFVEWPERLTDHKALQAPLWSIQIHCGPRAEERTFQVEQLA